MRRGSKPPIGPGNNTVYYTSSKKAAFRKPVCLVCEDKFAKRLSVEATEIDIGYFCSMRCAAAFGIFRANSLRMTWCEECVEWFEKVNPCPGSRERAREEAERIAAKNSLFPPDETDGSAL